MIRLISMKTLKNLEDFFLKFKIMFAINNSLKVRYNDSTLKNLTVNIKNYNFSIVLGKKEMRSWK